MVSSGTLEVVQTMENKTMLLRTLERYDYFGEQGFLHDADTECSVRTLSEC